VPKKPLSRWVAQCTLALSGSGKHDGSISAAEAMWAVAELKLVRHLFPVCHRPIPDPHFSFNSSSITEVVHFQRPLRSFKSMASDSLPRR